MKRYIKSSTSNRSIQYDTYSYNGPAYRSGKRVGDFSISTEAVSQAKAKSNIQYRIKKQLGLDKSVKIELDDDLLIREPALDELAPDEDSLDDGSLDSKISELEQLKLPFDEI